jgi:ribosome-binding factor A
MLPLGRNHAHYGVEWQGKRLMKPFKRADRVAGQIQKVLSELLHRDIKDPRLNMATITGVKMTKDLKVAYVYFTTSGSSDRNKRNQDAIDGFNSALGYIKRTLGGQLGLRYMPNIKFFYDESFDYGSKIDSLLKTIETKDEKGN